MVRFLMRLAHELGNGRALANARAERDDLTQVHARLDQLPSAA